MTKKISLAKIIADAGNLSDAELVDLQHWLEGEQRVRAGNESGGATHSPNLMREEKRGKITYRLEEVKCGKKECRCNNEGPLHGPYWYEYQRTKAGMKKRYIGKAAPSELQTGEAE